MIVIDDVRVQIDGAVLLDGVDLTVPPGRMLGLVGPNGAGKSTLLRTIAGLRRPTGGRVLLDERPVHTLRPQALARRIAYVPQDTALSFPFTAYQVTLMGRHAHGEQDAQAVLAEAGIPMIAITNNWGTLEEVKQNLTLLGRALGTEAKAAEITAELDRRADAVAERIGAVTDRPSVAILSNQAGRPFINTADVLTSDLVKRAGGDLVADRIGLGATGPVAAEQLIAADPDAILLVDVTGKGRASYAPLLDNPAVADLAAVRDDRVKLLPARISYGVGGVHLADGLEEIARWLHPETS
ncbi:ATP-binding cassette domain-containing protein [Nonomuraea aridisoli]|uniref:ABC transporter ATP-binding protein n=1 Tax=Nonomuraea aridisoli TaxID=2070368 RepID=A0A2W2F2W8_9ACTN|nr:ATP-binding cassette domain-containing protein [Nonomuraea aridisoli]PZG19308.1 hypothetical protein C1J01_12700 [Nonomuraea aridisoli]